MEIVSDINQIILLSPFKGKKTSYDDGFMVWLNSFSNLFNTSNERENQPTTLLRQSQTVPSLQFHAQSGKVGPGSPVRLGNDLAR